MASQLFTLNIKTTEMHTGGEPVRIFEAKYPELKGLTLLEKRRVFKNKFDFIRMLLMREPRGHLDMYGAACVEPDNPDADLAVLFLHNEGYSTMCGHAVIALSRYAVDKGLVAKTPPKTSVKIQCPCGLVLSYVHHGTDGDKTGVVTFHSVPSFLFKKDVTVNVPKYGEVKVDIAYGGAFYAILPASELKVNIENISANKAIKAATYITCALKETVQLTHPTSDDLAYLYGVIITDGHDDYSEKSTTNICIFADQQVDRSPTGSGVSARIALQYAKGQIKSGQIRKFISCIGTEFLGSPVEEIKCGEFNAVIVAVTGKAYYTGECNFYLEEDDPLSAGFILSK